VGNMSLVVVQSVTQTDGAVSRHDSPYQQVPVNQWSVQHVAQWLSNSGFASSAACFTRAGITGEQLLQLDAVKMKVSTC
jgi:hypothetical protein